MFGSDYPKIKLSLGRAALYDPYPAWQLDPYGKIQAANLMAFWLWNALDLSEPLHQDALLGLNSFALLAKNLARIPPEQNQEFYTKRFALARRLQSGRTAEVLAPLLQVLQDYPQQARLFEQAPFTVDQEWEYTVRIAPPGPETNTRLLTFHVANYRLEGGKGLLITYNPVQETLAKIEEYYTLLSNKYEHVVYALPEAEAPTFQPQSYTPRSYYPALVQDPLWYITEENRANQELIGAPTIGAHFLELFFSPQLRAWMGPLHETSAPRAIHYFDTFMVDFLLENHELHEGYVETMRRLGNIPDFNALLEISRRMHITLKLPDHPEAAFYTCRVLLPWRFDPGLTLQFRCMVRYLYSGLLVSPEHRHYLVTLLPENYETEVGILLLYLLASGASSRDTGITYLQQQLWDIAVIQTIQEGLVQSDPHWNPETAYQHIRATIDTTFTDETPETLERMQVLITDTAEMLEDNGFIEKETLLTMLAASKVGVRQ